MAPVHDPYTFYINKLHPDVAYDLARDHPPGANAHCARDGSPRLFDQEQLVRELHEAGRLVCAVFSTYTFDLAWFLDKQDGYGHLFYQGYGHSPHGKRPVPTLLLHGDRYFNARTTTAERQRHVDAIFYDSHVQIR